MKPKSVDFHNISLHLSKNRFCHLFDHFLHKQVFSSMVPAPGSRVVLLACGSFNPPTFMHLRMMELAKHALETKHGISVLQGIMSPVSDGYRKAGLVSAEHRINMLTLATSSSDWIISDPWEAMKPTWTRTLAALQYHTKLARERFGSDVKVVLVAGTDIVESFKRVLPNGEELWKKEDLVDILTSHGVVCLVREGARPHVILEGIDFLRELVSYLVVSLRDWLAKAHIN